MGPDYLEVEYDLKSHPFTSYPAKLAKYFSQRFDIKPGMRLLEPGCGRGEVLRAFQAQGVICTGSDISPTARDYCEHWGIEFESWGITREVSPFQPSTFDVVYSKSLIEHLREGELFIRQRLKLLKPGGLLLVLTSDWESNFRIFYDDFTHVRPYTRRSMHSLLQISGGGYHRFHRSLSV